MRLLRDFVKLFFRHFYTTLAWSYDLVAVVVSVGQWNDWVRSVLEPPPAEPILEIAHGPGHLLSAINSRGGRAFGLDASRQMCRMASSRLKRSGKIPRIVQARAQALPFRADAFRTLLSTFPTEFIMDPASLTEAYRALKLEGEFRIVPMAEIRGTGFLDRVAAWLFRATGQFAELPPSWSQPLTEVGFSVQTEEVLLPRSRVIRLNAKRAKVEQIG